MTDKQRSDAAAAIYKRSTGKRRLVLQVLDAALRPLTWFRRPCENTHLDEVKQVLVFEPGSLGDIVMLMPFLRTLRGFLPEASISVICRIHATKKKGSYDAISRSSVEALLLGQGLADELIPVVVPWLADVSPWKRYSPLTLNWLRFAKRLRSLRARKFDFAFSGGRSDIRYNLVLWLTGARRRIGYAFGGGGAFLTDVVVPNMGRLHQTDVSLQLLEYLGIRPVKDFPFLTIPHQEEAFAEGFLRDFGVQEGDLIVGVHGGSRVPTRQWGEHNFLEVAHRVRRDFGAKVIWFAEPGSSLPFPDTEGLIPAAFALTRFLSLLAKCHFLVCNESGPMHLAAAVGTPVVAVFGSGFPEWFAPAGDGHRVVIRNDMWCRPCADRCRWKEPYCLRLITVEQVMEAVSEAVRNIAPCRTSMQIKSLAPEGRSVEAYK